MRHICLGKLQRRSDDWITAKLEKGLPVPCDLISRKAITASDVVKPTRKCNGVTKFPKSLKKIGSFYSMKKSLAQVTHHHVYLYVFFYPSRFRFGRRNSHIFCKFNESFGRYKGCLHKKTATPGKDGSFWREVWRVIAFLPSSNL